MAHEAPEESWVLAFVLRVLLAAGVRRVVIEGAVLLVAGLVETGSVESALEMPGGLWGPLVEEDDSLVEGAESERVEGDLGGDPLFRLVPESLVAAQLLDGFVKVLLLFFNEHLEFFLGDTAEDSAEALPLAIQDIHGHLAGGFDLSLETFRDAVGLFLLVVDEIDEFSVLEDLRDFAGFFEA